MFKKPHKCTDAKQELGGSKKNEFEQKKKRKRPKYKDTPPTERKGILRSQQRGSAALRIMSQEKLQEMYGVKQGGRSKTKKEIRWLCK